MDTFIQISTVFGGLALFIYGMDLMGKTLQKAAGSKLKVILEKLTGNPITGILAGIIVTMIIQSSGATTVMTVGFVAAGLMTLPQAISVILGASIGTTITAQIVAFKLGSFANLFIAIGFIVFFFIAKRENIAHSIGKFVFAFGLLFVGLQTMSAAMEPFAESEVFANLIVSVSDYPVLGLLVGTLSTCLFQSSSVTIAILQNIASQAGNQSGNLMSLVQVMPLVLGCNIGSTVVALYSSIGSSTEAKRTAWASVLFKAITSVICMFVYIPFTKLIELIPTATIDGQLDISRQIANAHTIYNIISVIIFIPFIGLLAKLVTVMFKGKKDQIEKKTAYISDKVPTNTSLAIELATLELKRMANFTKEMLSLAVESFIEFDQNKIDRVNEMEEVVDLEQVSTIRYLSKVLATHSLTKKESEEITRLMKITSDIERVGDYSVNITESSLVKKEKKLPFSDSAYQEIKDSFGLLSQMLDDCIESMNGGNMALAEEVIADEDKIDDIEKELRQSHLQRLHDGLCNPESAITYIEIIHIMERIGDHCNNVAQAILGKEDHDINE